MVLPELINEKVYQSLYIEKRKQIIEKNDIKNLEIKTFDDVLLDQQNNIKEKTIDFQNTLNTLEKNFIKKNLDLESEFKKRRKKKINC
jgi:hypothetical protein